MLNIEINWASSLSICTPICFCEFFRLFWVNQKLFSAEDSVWKCFISFLSSQTENKSDTCNFPRKISAYGSFPDCAPLNIIQTRRLRNPHPGWCPELSENSSKVIFFPASEELDTWICFYWALTFRFMRLCCDKSPTIVKQRFPDDTAASLQVFTDHMRRQSISFAAKMQIMEYPKVLTSC